MGGGGAFLSSTPSCCLGRAHAHAQRERLPHAPLAAPPTQVLAFPSGIIRGALSNLGVSATVTAESAALPQGAAPSLLSVPLLLSLGRLVSD